MSENELSNITDETQQLEAMKAKMAEMQKEADQLRELQMQQQQQQQHPQQSHQEQQQQQQQQDSTTANEASGKDQSKLPNATEAEEDVDSRSVYVGSVDYGSTPEELQKHFQDCGSINRVTILMDKFTGHPKGFAYIEFADLSSVIQALALNDSLFRGRNLKVTLKRTNVPGMSASRGRGGFRGRGGGRGGFRGRGFPRGRGGFRGRGRFVPY